jgi:predicted mannosyl-3-phosphoglycerate phosphatase (HAD superfamily)
MVIDIQTVHHILKNTAVQNVNKPFVYITDLTSTLTNRYQYVKFDNVESEQQKMTCGVPQESTLGPLLFILYINDMPNQGRI